MSPDEARELLLDAAERCFERFGIAKTTIDDVADEAGVSRGTVYRYVSGRDDLVNGVAARIADRYMAEMAGRLAPDSSLADFLVESFADIVVRAHTDPALAPLLSAGGADLARLTLAETPVIAERARAFTAGLMAQATEAQLAELRDDVPIEDLIDHMMFTGVALILGLGPSPEDPDGLARYLRAFLLPSVLRAT